jgi:hypothetical protein
MYGILKGVLEDGKFNSIDDVEDAIAKAWDDLTFDEVQNVFNNWMSHLHRLLRMEESI